MKRIPVNLIAGPLGVGKTTAIRHLLKTRPEGERWAVLVNEFGLVGLDAALLEDPTKPAGIEVREVAGGCICCSAGFLFEVSLAYLLEQEPDRVLIEPTGLAALSGILDSLDRPEVRDRIDVRSTVCLLDPATAESDRQQEEVADQIEAADILLANRCDLATSAQLEAFSSFAEGLFPRKSHVAHVERGRVAGELLDAVSDRKTSVRRGHYGHGTDHHHEQDGLGGEVDREGLGPRSEEPDESQPIVRRAHISPQTSTVGWICHKDLVFEEERAVGFLAKLAGLPGARRTKAVLRTDDIWWSFNFTPRVREARPTAYRRDSRIEVIVDGDDVGSLNELDAALRQALLEEGERQS